ncbi:PREDICTED: small ubiquitin-related modifier 5 [Tarenaya hassleriana]|uniref:small ubiquitin-related modifier 5 n=1 Tax=Tarenaya hassleriana TaxID=28532 RepID=UPI00053CA357|nr:PREDICTED: small ubiquitin-related modifier 5 [Tarenaya hassleriana]XP_010522403.1 PREDICTED: small ubiquitin-related modifier 5 [Tarenaya hassleriana]XP_010522404.1 PREDICTED: small ubiquitin-related modifier 5 [Tarenaya hassleriana]XP_010522405.1 PREDICTED: small ubiquitin-related modifier 5 [Tarenaya hassleriana]
MYMYMCTVHVFFFENWRALKRGHFTKERKKKMTSSTTQSSAPKRPRASSSSAPKVTLMIKGQDGNTNMYKVSMDAPLKKLFMYYCGNRNLDHRTVRFIYKRHLLNAKQTPAKLMMEENDQIDAFMEQPGGGFYPSA